MKKLALVAILVMMLALPLSAQEETVETFPVAAEVSGIVYDIPDENSVIIGGVWYWLSDAVDPNVFVIGEPVTITVSLAGDVTMTVISATPAAEPVEETNPQETHPVASAIAEAMDVPYEEIAGWAESSFGYGEIARAYILADLIGGDVDVVTLLSLRSDAGAPWGAIMEEYGISPSQLAPGQIMSGRYVRQGVELPDDVEADGSLTSTDVDSYWYIDPDNLEEEAALEEGEAGEAGEGGAPGDFGCEHSGNYCNAPGWQKNFGEDGTKTKDK